MRCCKLSANAKIIFVYFAGARTVSNIHPKQESFADTKITGRSINRGNKEVESKKEP